MVSLMFGDLKLTRPIPQSIWCILFHSYTLYIISVCLWYIFLLQMTVVNLDIEDNNEDCMASSNNGISESIGHKKSSTDKENVPTSNNSYNKNRDKDHDERLGKRDSISKRESQGSGQSNDSRKSDESKDSNESNNSRSTITSVRSDNTDISIPSDNTPKETAPSTNPIQDSSAMYINAKYVHIGSSTTTIVNLHTEKLIVKS